MPARTNETSKAYGVGKNVTRPLGKNVTTLSILVHPKKAHLDAKRIAKKKLINQSIATKTPSNGYVRKPHRFKPGTVALRQIRKYQRSTEKLIPRAPFVKVCKKAANDSANMTSFPSGVRMTNIAIDCLQEGIEANLVKLFENGNIICIHRGRITVTAKDLQVVDYLNK